MMNSVAIKIGQHNMPFAVNPADFFPNGYTNGSAKDLNAYLIMNINKYVHCLLRVKKFNVAFNGGLLINRIPISTVTNTVWSGKEAAAEDALQLIQPWTRNNEFFLMQQRFGGATPYGVVANDTDDGVHLSLFAEVTGTYSKTESGSTTTESYSLNMGFACHSCYVDSQGIIKISVSGIITWSGNELINFYLSDTEPTTDESNLHYYNVGQLDLLGAKTNIWLEIDDAAVVTSSMDITITADEYWTWGGKYDSATGEIA